MSFYSLIELIHAAPPPVVTTAALASFVRRVAGSGIPTGIARGFTKPTCSLKFGGPIDKDERGIVIMDPPDGIVRRALSYPWDAQESFPSLDAIAESLAAPSSSINRACPPDSSSRRFGRRDQPASIYRAYFDFGVLADFVSEHMSAPRSPENESTSIIDALGFTIQPAKTSDYQNEPAMVGWMSLSFSGSGYFFPSTKRQARERAESLPGIENLVYACQRTWPITPAKPSARLIAARKELGDRWLYDDYDLPPGWLWFASET